jgi:hypothetical protein
MDDGISPLRELCDKSLNAFPYQGLKEMNLSTFEESTYKLRRLVNLPTSG